MTYCTVLWRRDDKKELKTMAQKLVQEGKESESEIVHRVKEMVLKSEKASKLEYRSKNNCLTDVNEKQFTHFHKLLL